mgnify:CR=1 FL=1
MLRHSAPAKGPGGLMFPPGMQAICMDIELHAYPTANIPDNTGVFTLFAALYIPSCCDALYCCSRMQPALEGRCSCWTPWMLLSASRPCLSSTHPGSWAASPPCHTASWRTLLQHRTQTLCKAYWRQLVGTAGGHWQHVAAHAPCLLCMFLAEAGASSPCQCLRAASCQHSRWPGAVHSCQAPCYALQVYPS